MIVEPDVHLAIWERKLPASLSALANQSQSGIDDIDEQLDVAGLDLALTLILEDAGYRDAGDAAREIAALGTRFASVTACERVRVRLEVIETDACRRFHSDYVTARLLLTLAGAGTQWRRAEDDSAINSLQPGEVAVFKGRVWTDEPAILHRSPPIAGTGADRLLLAIDPL
ncbi:DUF1826 domain-containing protein [Novosphingobium sp. ERN07]|nr:DUF1826 domain-containing protein [Novosphingobium sp. ERN07]